MMGDQFIAYFKTLIFYHNFNIFITFIFILLFVNAATNNYFKDKNKKVKKIPSKKEFINYFWQIIHCIFVFCGYILVKHDHTIVMVNNMFLEV